MVRKSNELIEAKYQIHDIGEQRVICMLLAQIQPNDEDFKAYRLSVVNFAKVLGLTGNSTYETLDRIASSLVSRKISIKNEKSFLHMNWLSSARYEHGSGYIELSFDPNLKPYLLQLKSHFTQYKLDNVLHFKSQYSIRLYEFLKKESFKAKNRKFEKYFEYEELREIFSIRKTEYLKFSHFKDKTINPAVLEISHKSDINIYLVQYGKTGKKITNVTFYVEIISEVEAPVISIQTHIGGEQKIKKSKIESSPIIDSLVNLGFPIETAKAYENKYDIKQLERNIAYTLAKKQEGKIKDIPSYLNTAIENDYGGAWVTENQKKVEAKKQQDKLEQAKKTAAEKETQDKKARYQKVFNDFLLLPENQQEELKQAFFETANLTVTGKIKEAQRKGIDIFTSPLVSSPFKVFLVEQKEF
jgi:plasmid replication initiation protein